MEAATERQEWRTTDKATWGAGAWQDEPDKAQWVDEATGLDCLIVRNRGGALCGYVGVPASHPWHGKDYSAKLCDPPCEESWCGHSPESRLEVHGGITFADDCHEVTRELWEKMRASYPGWQAEAVKYPRGDSAERVRDFGPFLDDYDGYAAFIQPRSICHIPAAGRPGNVWWFGFDCAHSGDLSPAHEAMMASFRGTAEWESYKDLGYVTREVTQLAAQLAAVPHA